MKQSELQKLLRNAEALFAAFPFARSAFSDTVPDEAIVDFSVLACLCDNELEVKGNQIVQCDKCSTHWYWRDGDTLRYAVEE